MPNAKSYRTVIKSVLSDISPTREDKRKLSKIQKEILSKIKVPYAKAVLGGSGAKNTWLKDTHDIDIYIKFSYNKYHKKSPELSDILHKYLKKSFKNLSRIHGSRDYFQTVHEGYTIELVPILEIKSSKDAKNITDFSHLHVKYINKKTKLKPRLNDEIRLAKTFAKANRFYGAESYIKGVSGYVLEILVSRYGSFYKFAKAVSEWRDTTIVGSKRVAKNLNWSKKTSPLILIDPVQPDRNAAAALSESQYKNMIVSCKKFIKKPSESLFEKKEIDIKKLERKGFLTILESQPLEGKRDISGAKALKALEFIIKKSKEFEVIDYVFDFNEDITTFFIVSKKKTLPKTYKHYGPPLEKEDALKNFKKVNKEPIKADKKLKKYYVIKNRTITGLRDHFKELLEMKEVSSRVKNITILN